MKRTLLAALALLAAAAPSAPAAAQPPARPRLIVAISVDQFSADLYAEYRQHFTGGLRRLSNGMVFPSGYQSHGATETCPGHSTILTGARPARTGIIANDWFDPAARPGSPAIYCAEDERVPGSTTQHYTVSPVHLRVPTLGDLMRQADPRARAVAVAGKDRAAIMMGGHNPDQRWWWEAGAFVSHAGTNPSAAVRAVNGRMADAIARGRDAMALPDICEARSRAIAVPGHDPVGAGRFARAPRASPGAFRASPDFDAAIVDLALGLRDEMNLGEGPATDLLAIGLSATDYVGHTYGTQGAEMCIQMIALDHALSDLFQALDRRGIDFVAVLTADHGGLDLPERAGEQAGGGERALAPLGTDNMNKILARTLGLPGPFLAAGGPSGDIYLSPNLPPRQRARVLSEAIAAYGRQPQVAFVYSRAQIVAAPAPSGPPETWSLLQRIRASYDPQRSGDFYVVLRPRVTPIIEPRGTDYVATHGSVWDYDRRVPILFWRRGMIPFEQPMSVETVDIMPTLAGLIGLPVAPGSIDGHCLDLDAGPGSTCPGH
jgi:predicted AlkP superfamily pyrophosphatase or phosphodiesterase